jgi:hypothetical protein
MAGKIRRDGRDPERGELVEHVFPAPAAVHGTVRQNQSHRGQFD